MIRVSVVVRRLESLPGLVQLLHHPGLVLVMVERLRR